MDPQWYQLVPGHVWGLFALGFSVVGFVSFALGALLYPPADYFYDCDECPLRQQAMEERIKSVLDNRESWPSDVTKRPSVKLNN